MRSPAKLFFLLSFLSFMAYGVSGIAVVQIANGGKIKTIHIKDNAIVDSFYIGQGSSPQINTSGTHVAFIRRGGNTIAIVRSDIPETDGDHAIKELITTTDPLGGVDWPKGDWVWYATTPPGSRTNSHVHRVHVNTLESQDVVSYTNASLTDFRVTGDGSNYYLHGRATATLPGGGNPDGCYAIIAPNPDTETIPVTAEFVRADVSYGPCGMGLTPSGRHSASNAGSGHTTRDFWNIDLAAKTVERPPYIKTDVDVWNNWSLDSEFQYCVEYNKDPCYRIERVGGGAYTASNWSCNSEYWDIPVLGWSQGGRFGGNGSNMVLINYVAQQSLNVSRFPHRDVGSDLYPAGTRRNVNEGDCWIYAPLSDVTPELLPDIQSRESFEIEGLFVGSKMDIDVSSVEAQLTINARSSEISIGKTGSSIHLNRYAIGSAAVSLVGVDGATICTKKWNTQSLTLAAVPQGIWIVRVKMPSGIWSSKTCITGR
ncbi:MAG: hypothetical protein GF350_12220 [Chitinivibrionales bacterium]|nr:hypothetical protein [Chitinivibrionales bacterium]